MEAQIVWKVVMKGDHQVGQEDQPASCVRMAGFHPTTAASPFHPHSSNGEGQAGISSRRGWPANHHSTCGFPYREKADPVFPERGRVSTPS